jgi:hypothetical protein
VSVGLGLVGNGEGVDVGAWLAVVELTCVDAERDAEFARAWDERCAGLLAACPCAGRRAGCRPDECEVRGDPLALRAEPDGWLELDRLAPAELLGELLGELLAGLLGELLGLGLLLLVLLGGGHTGFRCWPSRSTMASASPLLLAVIPDST